MKFSEMVAQALAWLQREGRVSYRALRLEFDLNDDVLDALKEELIAVKESAVDKDGKMLVWVGERIKGERQNEGETANRRPPPSPQFPTRPHISPNASALNKRRWKRAGQPMVNVRPLRRCLPISKARRP